MWDRWYYSSALRSSNSVQRKCFGQVTKLELIECDWTLNICIDFFITSITFYVSGRVSINMHTMLMSMFLLKQRYVKYFPEYCSLFHPTFHPKWNRFHPTFSSSSSKFHPRSSNSKVHPIFMEKVIFFSKI